MPESVAAADVQAGHAATEASEAVIARARAGARLLTMRGVAMRALTIGANLLLIGLVTPAQLGLLAVVRGTLTLVQFGAELGVDRVLLRRPEEPTRDEFAALAGMQTLVVSSVVAVGLLVPSLLTAAVHLDVRWSGWLLGSLVAMLAIPLGTGARVRLERALAYERLARVDVMNVAIQNVGLVVAALLGRFEEGVFVVFALMLLAVNLTLFAWSRGPLPSFRIARLRAIAAQSAGFMGAQWLGVLREQAVPLVIARLFGLGMAGTWAFAIRLTQLLNVTFEGYRAAAVPAAARVAHDREALRRIAQQTADGVVALAVPVMALLFAGLPLVGQMWPQWSPAVPLAQAYVLAFGVAGVMDATLEPLAVSLFGARVALLQQAAALLGLGVGIALAWSVGTPLAVAVVAMSALSVLLLRSAVPRPVCPAFGAPLAGVAWLLAVAVLAVLTMALLALPPILPAAVTSVAVGAHLATRVVGRRAVPLAIPGGEG